MSLVDDIANDLLIVDGLLSVSLALIRTTGTTTVSIASAQREAIGKNVANYAGVMLQGNETVWHIPDTLLNPAANGRVINANDEITYSGTVYVVLAVRQDVLSTVWACVCNLRM